MSETPRAARLVLRNVYFCFFLSGSLGLIYQILWLRKLLLVFGSTVHAVSTVLTVFFAGLALGSWLFGRWIDRRELSGLRWYAAIEVAIGLYAFITLPLFDVIQRLYLPMYRASDFSPTVLVGASFVCSVLILLIPTTLLGATFPVLTRFLVRSTGERGTKIAGLYALNTAGAVLGTLFVYYVGLPILGLVRTLVCVGVLNIGIGALCLAFDRHLENLGFHRQAAPAPEPVAEPRESRGVMRWLLVAFGLSGFSAMAYEVTWTRALGLVLGSSVYAFCLMLVTFLSGIALGSGWARVRLRQAPATIRQFVILELLLGGYGLVGIALFSQLPDWLVTLWPLAQGSLVRLSWIQIALCAIIMLPPTIIMGYLFPVVGDLVTKRFATLGRRIGTVYAVNTLGGIFGSFLSGFVLIPWLGLPWSMAIAALINVAAGVLMYVCYSGASVPRRLAFGAAALAAAALGSQVVITKTWHPQAMVEGAYLHPDQFRGSRVAGNTNSKIIYYRDSLNTTVSVHQSGDQIFLKVGGKTDASTGLDMGTQVLAAHIPLLLHPDPKRVLVVGLGSGVTLGHAGRYPVTTLDCAEIDEAVVEAARFFHEYNYNVHDDPRTRIIVADGRNVLLAGTEQYDVIISEPSNPWMAGLAYLFTREYYQLAKRRLSDDGLMCQWLQLYRIFPEDVKLILKTFHDTFPYVSVWSAIPGDLLLVGSMRPQTVPVKELARRMSRPDVKDALEVIGVTGSNALLSMYVFGESAVEQLTADTPWVHEDDRPWLEFSAPKAMYLGVNTIDLNYDGLWRFSGDPSGLAPGYTVPADDDVDTHLALAKLWRKRGQRSRVVGALEDAVAADAESGEAWTRLGEAYLQNPRSAFKARDALRRAVDLIPEAAEAYQLLGLAHWQQGQFDEAQSWFEAAARRVVPDAELAQTLGNFFNEAGELEWSAEYYRSAISQGAGDHAWVLAGYGGVLRELEVWDEASAVLRVGARRFAGNVTFALQLGELLLEQDQVGAAAGWFQQVLAVAPNSAPAYYGLGRVAQAEGQQQTARYLFKRTLRYDAYHRAALEQLGAIEGRTKVSGSEAVTDTASAWDATP